MADNAAPKFDIMANSTNFLTWPIDTAVYAGFRWLGQLCYIVLGLYTAAISTELFPFPFPIPARINMWVYGGAFALYLALYFLGGRVSYLERDVRANEASESPYA